MISVVIPCFNEPADRLDRTVLSALESIDADRGDEVIVVNDGGETIEIKGETVRVVNLSENHGPSGALNAGYAEARGKHIARLDVGDVFYPEAKRRQFAAVIANDTPASFSLSVDENTGEVYPLAPNWSARIYRDGQFRTSTTVVRKDVWERVRWDASLRRLDDWGWTVRVQHSIGWSLFDEVTGTATMLAGGYSDKAQPGEIKAARLKVWKMAQSLRRTRAELRP